jgi:YbbR domain-containing protein
VRRLVELLAKDPLLKLTALVLAFLLWALVASERASTAPRSPESRGTDSAQSRLDPAERSRSVPVAVRLTGQPMPGWEIAGRPQIDPTHLTVTGPALAVERIDSVYLPAIQLDGRMASATLDIAVDTVDLGVSVKPARVRVRIPIRLISPETSSGGTAERPGPVQGPTGAAS